MTTMIPVPIEELTREQLNKLARDWSDGEDSLYGASMINQEWDRRHKAMIEASPRMVRRKFLPLPDHVFPNIMGAGEVHYENIRGFLPDDAILVECVRSPEGRMVYFLFESKEFPEVPELPEGQIGAYPRLNIVTNGYGAMRVPFFNERHTTWFGT